MRNDSLTSRARTMRHVIGLVVLLTGCASPEYYRPGPPVTVQEPMYSGPTVSAPRSSGGPIVTPPPGAPEPIPCEPVRPMQRATFMDWLRSGRGWTWGRASYEPIRDEGLDRLMMDTLSNNRPEVSREPLPPVTYIPSDVGSWIFPSAPNNSPDPGY